MSKFNFKSTGINITTVKTVADAKKIQQINAVQNIGIKTPLQVGNGTLFAMHDDISEQVIDNFKNLILTNHGERLALYDFGANLRDVLTEYNSDIQDQYEEIITDRIINAAQKWMPFINVQKISTETEKNTVNGLAVVLINIIFNIDGVSSENRELKVRMFVI